MKKIKIRYVKRINQKGEIDYLLQRRTWYGGWKYYRYPQSGGMGETIFYLYCDASRTALLNKVIDEHHKTTRSHVQIIEYPTLKIHK